MFQVEFFCVVTPGSAMVGCFRGPCGLHLHPENAGSTQRHNPEDLDLEQIYTSATYAPRLLFAEWLSRVEKRTPEWTKEFADSLFETAWREADHSPPSASTSQYALMAWCSVKPQGQLYLYLLRIHHKR
jgi:hypothetical protein